MPTLRRLPGPAALVAVLSCAAALSSCGRDQPGEEPTVANNLSQAPRPNPVVEPPLDRERLLLAAVRAASAFAAGSNDSEAQRTLDGKRFELRMRFGCGDGENDARGWRFDETSRTLKLRVTQDISRKEIVAAQIVGDQFETIEGLWLGRPWLLAASCPMTPPSVPAAAAAAKETPESRMGRAPIVEAETNPVIVASRVGIAQFLTSADSRTLRRGERPYETTTVLDEGQRPSAQGYDFVMSGRLRSLPDRRVIICSANGPDAPPDCIISVHVDRVWIEQPDNRQQIAEWTG